MKLPTSLGGMGIRAVTSQLEVSFHHRNLTGKRKTTGEGHEHEGNELWDGNRAEAMTGSFQWDRVNAAQEHGISISISRTLKTHEIITAHTLWSRLCTTGNAAFLVNCGQGVGATWGWNRARTRNARR